MGKGLNLFMENQYWKEKYENAPSNNLKEYYRLMFDYRSFVSEETIPEEIQTRLKNLWLNREDLRYLIQYAGMNLEKMQYQKCINKIDEGPEGTCVAAIACTGVIRNPWYKPPEE